MTPIVATHHSETALVYHLVFSSVSPLKDKTAQDTDEHNRFYNFVLSVFGKSENNVVMLIEDNCSLKLSIAKNWKHYF